MSTATSEARHVVREHRAWLETLARSGYATRGVLYLIIGGLAAMAAFGYGGETTDAKGALLELYSQPFGEVLLALAAAGLASYSAFLACRAALDPEAEARKAWGPAKRGWWGLMALLHAGLAAYAISLLVGAGSAASGHGDQTRSLTGAVLSWRPLGPWVVAATGVGFVVGAGYGLYCAWRAKLDDQLDLTSVSIVWRGWLVRLSRLGIAARACVALVAGAFLLVAAVESSAAQAKGFAASLGALRAMPFGAWLFAAVAVGLVAFGCYQLVEARYRRILGSGA